MKNPAVTDRSAEPLMEPMQKFSASASPTLIPPLDRPLPYPLSPGQRRMWFLEQLNPGLACYNEGEAVRLFGELNVDAMERAMNIIVARHEVLRTTVQVTEGEPVAVVHDNWPVQIKKIDLSALAAPERQGELERLLIHELGQPYHLETEPGIRTTLAPSGRSGAYIHFDDASHHL